MSYYDLLSIASTASTDDFKKAYRKKALELHPDRHALLCDAEDCVLNLSTVADTGASAETQKVQRTDTKHSRPSAKPTR